MKIVITEDKIDYIKDLIKSKGVEFAIEKVGGFDILTKLLGYKNVDQYIYQYLSDKFDPDYGWEDNDFYKNQVRKFGSYLFTINNYESYEYITYSDGGKKLDIKTWLYNELDELFEDYDWKSIFKKWFEDNTGLKVDWVE
jgi:hypothetical protein